MENEQKQYELTCILNPRLETGDLDKFKQELEKIINDKEGKIIHFMDAEKKGLAYPINKLQEGIYLTGHVEIKPEYINEISKEIKSNKQVLRHLITYVKVIKEKSEKPRIAKKPAKIRKSPVKSAEKTGIKLEEIDKKLDELVGL